MAILHSNEASVYNKCLGGIISKLLIATTYNLCRLLFTFLKEEVHQVLDVAALATQQIMWFMYDASPAHFTHDIKQFFDSSLSRSMDTTKHTTFVAS
jgi:hypothetical protein